MHLQGLELFSGAFPLELADCTWCYFKYHLHPKSFERILKGGVKTVQTAEGHFTWTNCFFKILSIRDISFDGSLLNNLMIN